MLEFIIDNIYILIGVVLLTIWLIGNFIITMYNNIVAWLNDAYPDADFIVSYFMKKRGYEYYKNTMNCRYRDCYGDCSDGSPVIFYGIGVCTLIPIMLYFYATSIVIISIVVILYTIKYLKNK